jgi:hypothetical protein
MTQLVASNEVTGMERVPEGGGRQGDGGDACRMNASSQVLLVRRFLTTRAKIGENRQGKRGKKAQVRALGWSPKSYDGCFVACVK